MTVLIIIAILLLLVCIALCLSVSVYASFTDGLKFKVKYANFVLYEYPVPIKKKLKKSKKKNKKSAAKKPKKKKGLRETLKSGKGLTENVKTVASTLLDFLKSIGKLVRHIKINKCKLYLTVASDDAYTTATVFGEACSVIYPIAAIIDTNVGKNKTDMRVAADFDVINPELDFEFSGKIRLFFFCHSLILFLKDTVKRGTKKGVDKNERK